jgi:hypothetical protein
MVSYIVSVAGRRFSVGENEIARLREELSEAARSGGAFVSFDYRGATVDVMVSPGVPVFIEQVPEPEPELHLAAAGAVTAESLVAAMDEFDDWGI